MACTHFGCAELFCVATVKVPTFSKDCFRNTSVDCRGIYGVVDPKNENSVIVYSPYVRLSNSGFLSSM